MYDDEYNASIEWYTEIGPQGRCMWVSMGECEREEEGSIICATVSAHENTITLQTYNMTENNPFRLWSR